MKRSRRVTLTVVATVGLGACGHRRMDPCEAAAFHQQACQEAIDRGGYYWQGSWYAIQYHYPYPYYFDSYRSYVSGGGQVSSAPAGAYWTGASAPAPSEGVERGGFGSTGAGHEAGE